MLHWILRLIFRPVGFIVTGLAAMGLGGYVFVSDPTDLPTKASLKQVSGVLEQATKITTKRRVTSTVNYELEVRPASGENLKFKLPEREIAEAQVRALVGEPLSILYSASSDVWELTTGKNTVISYDTTRSKRQQSAEEMKAASPYVGLGGLLTMLAGFFWRSRRAA